LGLTVGRYREGLVADVLPEGVRGALESRQEGAIVAEELVAAAGDVVLGQGEGRDVVEVVPQSLVGLGAGQQRRRGLEQLEAAARQAKAGGEGVEKAVLQVGESGGRHDLVSLFLLSGGWSVNLAL
jgi:hypothetical protein